MPAVIDLDSLRNETEQYEGLTLDNKILRRQS